MHELILLGPFLTRADAARYTRLDPLELAHRPDLLRIGKPPLDEAYFGFQFHLHAVDEDVGKVVMALRGAHDDMVIADWLVRPNHRLRGSTPLAWLSEGGSLTRAIEAAHRNGPGAA